jgi:hypothetical protein
MSSSLIRYFQLSLCGLIGWMAASGLPVAAQPNAPTQAIGVPNSYIGIGSALGLSGNTTALGSGGLVILSKLKFSDNFSLHDATIILGNSAATSMIIVSADLPILNNSGQTMLAPFIGGGAMVKYDRGLSISPAISGGIDVPISSNLTGTLRLNAGFPSNQNADVGVLVGAGYTFGN